MPESLGIDELRRRVQKDPASIAFAHLAEELRKAGEHDEAVRVCRAGLERHPTYLSAHVTLGRALIGLQQYAEARTELERVLHAAPDNLLAQKGMHELQEREGDAQVAPEPAQALGAEASAKAAGPRVQSAGPHAEPAAEPPKPNLRIQTAPEPPNVEPPAAEAAPPNGGPPPEHPAVGELEDWQARIQADRARRSQ